LERSGWLLANSNPKTVHTNIKGRDAQVKGFQETTQMQMSLKREGFTENY
jgi:hypothetical protein